MQTNFISIQDIIGVDHVSFDEGPSTNQGMHNQVTYSMLYPNADPNLPLPPVVPANSQGISYVENDSVGNINQWFVNPTANYLVSCVKAFGVFQATSNNANVTPLNSYNINTPITKPGPSNVATYAITLKANVVSGNNVLVFINTSNNVGATYTFSGGLLTIVCTSNIPIISFMILQA